MVHMCKYVDVAALNPTPKSAKLLLTKILPIRNIYVNSVIILSYSHNIKSMRLSDQ